VHRAIGVLQQGAQVVAVARTGADTDARGDFEFLAVQHHRLRHSGQDLFGYLGEIAESWNVSTSTTNSSLPCRATVSDLRTQRPACPPRFAATGPRLRGPGRR